MSAIDFRTSVKRKADPKGDRVVIELDGKFLPYSKVGEGGSWPADQ
jgi:cyanate lyase